MGQRTTRSGMLTETVNEKESVNDVRKRRSASKDRMRNAGGGGSDMMGKTHTNDGKTRLNEKRSTFGKKERRMRTQPSLLVTIMVTNLKSLLKIKRKIEKID